MIGENSEVKRKTRCELALRIEPKVLLPGGRVGEEVKEVVAPKVLLPCRAHG